MPGPVDPAASRAAARPMRLARSIAAALVCTITAALGHLAGGGVIPTGVALVAFAGSTLVAWSLSTRQVSTGQLIGLLVLCQVGVHFASTSMNMSVLMVATHLFATAASAALLTCGERFVWRLAERFGVRVLGLLRVRPVPSGSPAAPVSRTRVLANALLTYSRIERGPPIAS